MATVHNPNHIPGQPNPHLMNDQTQYFQHTPHSLLAAIRDIGYIEFQYTQVFTQPVDNTFTANAEATTIYSKCAEMYRKKAKALIFYNGHKRDIEKLTTTKLTVWVSHIQEIAEYRVIDAGIRQDLVFSNFVITLKTGQQLFIYANMVGYKDNSERLYIR